MADARAVNFSPSDLAPILQVPPGAAGVAQQPEVITPPGYYNQQSPWAGALDQIFGNMQQQVAQQRTIQQYNQAVQGIGEFWPQLQAMGVSEGQVNSMLKSGMSPQDIVHSAFTDEASRHLKQFEWGREDYTHARGVSEESYTPDQLDVVDKYMHGQLSLSDTVRQSGLKPSNLSAAMSALGAGTDLQNKLATTTKNKEELAGLPEKQQQQAKKLNLEIDELLEKKNNARTPEEKAALEVETRSKIHERDRIFDVAHPLPTKPTSTKGLPVELQQQANTLKGLATPQAMYQQAKKAGLDVRQPTKAPSETMTYQGKTIDLGIPSGKGESKDAYYRNVILPALQNKHLSSPTNGTQSFSYPNTPVGKAAQQAAREFGLDANIFGRQIQQESGFNPAARSGAGAIGPAQLMPATAKALGVDPNNPSENVRGGAKYMKQLLDKYGGDYTKALSAYNAGPDPRNWNNRETQNYVRSILGADQATPTAKQLSKPQKRKSLDDIL